MDGAQVLKIEVAAGRAFGSALGDQPTLDPVEFVGINDTEFIPKNRSTGIGVRVVRVHSAANRTAWARI